MFVLMLSSKKGLEKLHNLKTSFRHDAGGKNFSVFPFLFQLTTSILWPNFSITFFFVAHWIYKVSWNGSPVFSALRTTKRGYSGCQISIGFGINLSPYFSLKLKHWCTVFFLFRDSVVLTDYDYKILPNKDRDMFLPFFWVRKKVAVQLALFSQK